MFKVQFKKYLKYREKKQNEVWRETLSYLNLSLNSPSEKGDGNTKSGSS